MIITDLKREVQIIKKEEQLKEFNEIESVSESERIVDLPGGMSLDYRTLHAKTAVNDWFTAVFVVRAWGFILRRASVRTYMQV